MYGMRSKASNGGSAAQHKPEVGSGGGATPALPQPPQEEPSVSFSELVAAHFRWAQELHHWSGVVPPRSRKSTTRS